jgi:hypothetical protein
MPDPKLEVLTPHNCQLIFIDHQPQMAFSVAVDRAPDAEEQHGCVGQGREDLWHPDHDHDGRERQLLRLRLSGAAERVPRAQDSGADLDERVGRPEGARRARRYDAVIAVVQEHSGAYGMGVDYAYTMVHKAPQRPSGAHEVLAPLAAA